MLVSDLRLLLSEWLWFMLCVGGGGEGEQFLSYQFPYPFLATPDAHALRWPKLGGSSKSKPPLTFPST